MKCVLFLCLSLAPIVAEGSRLRAANASTGKVNASTGKAAPTSDVEIDKVRASLVNVTTVLKPSASTGKANASSVAKPKSDAEIATARASLVHVTAGLKPNASTGKPNASTAAKPTSDAESDKARASLVHVTAGLKPNASTGKANASSVAKPTSGAEIAKVRASLVQVAAGLKPNASTGKANASTAAKPTSDAESGKARASLVKVTTSLEPNASTGKTNAPTGKAHSTSDAESDKVRASLVKVATSSKPNASTGKPNTSRGEAKPTSDVEIAKVRASLVKVTTGLKPNASTGNANASTGKAAPTRDAEIDKVRASLVKVTTGLKPMLDPRGAFAATELGTSLRTFWEEAQVALNETAGKKDHASLARLQNVSAEVRSLFQALTSRQQTLIAESEDQQNSLLLGVLMSKQHELMDSQREVLQAPDFAALPVAKALLASGDAKTPLFKQAAAYFDARPHRVAITPEAGKPNMSNIVSSLQARLKHLESSMAHAHAVHDNETRHLKEEEEKGMNTSKAKADRIRSLRKAEDRRFAKMIALEGKDVQGMKDAITAIEHGDIQGLKRAQAALTASLAAMQSPGGFLVLVQETLRDAGMDCPYCDAH